MVGAGDRPGELDRLNAIPEMVSKLGWHYHHLEGPA